MSLGFQLKITIKNSHPPIWRRIIVPSGISFRDLDDIIEEIFGWTHSHLFEFSFGYGDSIGCSSWGDDDDNTDECIDSYMEEGAAFTYIYDFGDDWVHTIKVEKIFPRAERYAEVLKSKGPNMLEDCGGIWGFYEVEDAAEPFDLISTNKILRETEYPEKEYFTSHMPQEKDFGELEDRIRSFSPIPHSLKDIFKYYSKKDMIEIARLHGFTGYSRFNKSELAEWLKNCLLETEYMKEIFLNAAEQELEIFHGALQEGGILVPQEMIEHSLLLASYCCFNTELTFLQVARDVQEKYEKIATPEFLAESEERHKIQYYCIGAVYLYGAVPLEKLPEIYYYYEKKYPSKETLNHVLDCLMGKQNYRIFNGCLMDDRILENDFYIDIMKEQKDYTPYLPKTKEEMLHYGLTESPIPNEASAAFLEFMEKKAEQSPIESMIMLTIVSEELRLNSEEEEMIELILDFGCKLHSQKRIRELMTILEKISMTVRRWELNGHTISEINNMRSKNAPMAEQSKIIPITRKPKIYPNDPCPCGSGKKYKNCCGR